MMGQLWQKLVATLYQIYYCAYLLKSMVFGHKLLFVQPGGQGSLTYSQTSLGSKFSDTTSDVAVSH